MATICIRGDDELGHFEYAADGYYCFMYPLLVQLEARTGQKIDPYRDAYFEKESLHALKETFLAARGLVCAQRPDFDVVSHWADRKKKNPAHVDRVHRDDFLWWLDRLIRLVDRAIELGKQIDCIGD